MTQFIELSHIIEDGMRTYTGLPGPIISDHMNREASRGHYDEKLQKSPDNFKRPACFLFIYLGSSIAGRMRRQREHSRGERAFQRSANLVMEPYPRRGLL
jgi:hypothetical protein